MKAIISKLWETGIDIITTESDDDNITSLADLRKCGNVIVGEKQAFYTEVLINDLLIYVSFRTVTHPTNCGKLRICEIN